MSNMQPISIRPDLRDSVREHYATAARTVSQRGMKASCCGDATEAIDTTAIANYAPDQIGELPQDAVLASLGCGNPTALAELNPGEVVLDLGSGGGIDVLLSARRVGSTGYAYGLDMTDEMLELAERNRTEAGIENVQFLKGHIEEIPLPDNSVDVIISNCVINLSGDKDQVLREAMRVLRPGGRFAVSDIVLRGQLPEAVRSDVEAWSACVAGALTYDEYEDKLEAAGFTGIDLEETQSVDSSAASGACCSSCAPEGASESATDNVVTSAFVRAIKPAE